MLITTGFDPDNYFYRLVEICSLQGLQETEELRAGGV